MQFQFIPQSELSEQCLRAHPVWIAWEDPEQDEEISSWGVDVAAAWKKAPPSEDAEYCFPYLGQKPPALVRGVYLAATAHLASGQTLFGYLTGGYVFAVFNCGKTFLFNVNAAIHGKETVGHLGRSLNTAANSIFPIAFEPASSLYKGKEVEYQSFWQEEYEEDLTTDSDPLLVSNYLKTLKAFIEGKKDLREWPAWWLENKRLIENNEGAIYLKTKWATKWSKLEEELQIPPPLGPWREVATKLLEHHNISYKLNEAINWKRCTKCGDPIFSVSPGETTQEQIREFARNSKLPEKEELIRDGWMHPGAYCPNGCYSTMAHL